MKKEPIKMVYTNYRGSTSIRAIIPEKIIWGSNEWHTAPCWLLCAFDIDKQEVREFALSDANFIAVK